MTNSFKVKRLEFQGPNGRADNISIGIDTLKNTISDNDNRNIAIGDYVLANSTANGSIAIGHYVARYAGANFDNNIAIGKNTMYYFNQSGVLSRDYNIAIGHSVMGASGTDCNNNIGIGSNALEKTKGTAHTIAIGNQAVAGSGTVANNTGGPNIGIGRQSLRNITSGWGNIGIGAYSMSSISTGERNTAIGFYTASFGAIVTGSNNTMIGYYAAPSSSSVSNEFTLGNSSITNLRCNDTTISSLSDIRDKKNIEDIPLGLSYINSMRPVMFDWDRRDGSFEGKKDFGFIAQELDALEESFGYREYTRLVHKDNPDKWEADPMKTFPILIKAIQELSSDIEKIKKFLNIN